MVKKLNYLVEYESRSGHFQEVELEVNFKVVNKVKYSILDEMARRHIIANILKKGGRTIKIEGI